MKKITLVTALSVLFSLPAVPSQAEGAELSSIAAKRKRRGKRRRKRRKKPPPPPPASKKEEEAPEAQEAPEEAPAADTPAPPPPPSSGPVSAAQKAAEKAMAADDVEAAAVTFASIATGSAEGDQGRAQYWLGKALYKLEFYAAAAAVFGQIVEVGGQHPYHRNTLLWLAQLSRVLPEGAGVLDKVGTYKPTELENEAFDEVRNELYYLLGRHFYRKGDLAQANALLGRVVRDSDYYIPAQFFAGVASTREFKAQPAVAAFKEVLRKNAENRANEDNRRAKRDKKKKARLLRKLRRKNKSNAQTAELEFDEQNERFAELANLSLGYIFYQVGKFETAVKYYNFVPMNSPYWLDAVFASAWSEFRMVEVDPKNANVHYQRALGYIHTLDAPFFNDHLYPEATILKAVTYYYNCRYDQALDSISDFTGRYKTTKEQLTKVLESAKSDFDFFELTVKILKGESDLEPFVERIARKSLQDKTLEKHYQYVERLQGEQERLAEMSGPFRDGPAGDVVTDNIDINLSVAKEASGALARKRIQAQISEIRKLEREAIRVEYEVYNKLQTAGKRNDQVLQRPKVDKEHEIYRYNGEYWQDELGFYFFQVTSWCKE